MSSAQLCRHKLTVDDYYKIGEAGVLKDQDRVELIEGELIDMAPIGSHHAYTIDKLVEIVYQQKTSHIHIRVQNPLRLNEYNAPEPDLCIVKKKDYSMHHPEPSDTLLIIEVADSSLSYDLSIKVPLFATYDIPEVWVMDINEKVLHIFRQRQEGNYQYVDKKTSGSISPIEVPGLIFEIESFWS